MFSYVSASNRNDERDELNDHSGLAENLHCALDNKITIMLCCLGEALLC